MRGTDRIERGRTFQSDTFGRLFVDRKYRRIGNKAQDSRVWERLFHAAHCVYTIQKHIFSMSVAYNIGICLRWGWIFKFLHPISQHTTAKTHVSLLAFDVKLPVLSLKSHSSYIRFEWISHLNLYHKYRIIGSWIRLSKVLGKLVYFLGTSLQNWFGCMLAILHQSIMC